MKKVYKDVTQELPTNAPIPLGTPIQVNCFVDYDHAGDRLTRRSQSGILLFCNSAPIYWYSKKQNTVEASTYGAELVALHLAAELVVSLCCKLQMFGIQSMDPQISYVTMNQFIEIFPLHIQY